MVRGACCCCCSCTVGALLLLLLRGRGPICTWLLLLIGTWSTVWRSSSSSSRSWRHLLLIAHLCGPLLLLVLCVLIILHWRVGLLLQWWCTVLLHMGSSRRWAVLPILLMTWRRAVLPVLLLLLEGLVGLAVLLLIWQLVVLLLTWRRLHVLLLTRRWAVLLLWLLLLLLVWLRVVRRWLWE